MAEYVVTVRETREFLVKVSADDVDVARKSATDEVTCDPERWLSEYVRREVTDVLEVNA